MFDNTHTPNVKGEVRAITPAIAEEWLGKSKSNRRLNHRMVTAYATDMKSGKWKTNGEPVIFSGDELLLAGRHRLAACLEANTQFETVVVTGIPEDAFDTIDALRKRTVGDILSIRQLPSGRALAAALNIIWKYRNDDLASTRKRPPIQELLELLTIYPELQDASDPRGSIAMATRAKSVIPLGQGIGLHFLFSQVDQEAANDFFEQIVQDSDDADTAGAVLRYSLFRMNESGGTRSSRVIAAIIIKAWNAYRNNNIPRLLRYVHGKESFPEISGLDADANESNSARKSPHSASKKFSEKSSNIRVEYVYITPDKAKEILAKHPLNRHAASAVIDRYARDMKAGNWKLNGQTIKIASNGNLIDGQHRLKASVEANVSFPSLVVYGVDPDAFDTFDLGAKKSYHNILSERGETHTTTLAASIKWLWLYERGNLLDRSVQPTPAELDDLLDANPDIRKSLSFINKLRDFIPPASTVFLHYQCAKINRVHADQFFNKLSDGLGLTQGDPIHILRQKLIKERAKAKRVALNDVERMVWVIKAWNAYRDGLQIKNLKWGNAGSRKEDFPNFK